MPALAVALALRGENHINQKERITFVKQCHTLSSSSTYELNDRLTCRKAAAVHAPAYLQRKGKNYT